MGDRFREHMFAHHLPPSPLASNFGAFFCVFAENYGENAIFRRFFARTAALGCKGGKLHGCDGDINLDIVGKLL